ncbi:hypothetical protein [Asaia krungthepensis]|nr:hypothetical protein [Asaia krungthepensis]
MDAHHPIAPHLLARPDGLMPVLLRMAEELWRRDCGSGLFGLVLIADPEAWTGYRVTRIHHATASIVLTAIDAVIEEVLDMAGHTRLSLAHFEAWTQINARP